MVRCVTSCCNSQLQLIKRPVPASVIAALPLATTVNFQSILLSRVTGHLAEQKFRLCHRSQVHWQKAPTQTVTGYAIFLSATAQQSRNSACVTPQTGVGRKAEQTFIVTGHMLCRIDWKFTVSCSNLGFKFSINLHEGRPWLCLRIGDDELAQFPPSEF